MRIQCPEWLFLSTAPQREVRPADVVLVGGQGLWTDGHMNSLWVFQVALEHRVLVGLTVAVGKGWRTDFYLTCSGCWNSWGGQVAVESSKTPEHVLSCCISSRIVQHWAWTLTEQVEFGWIAWLTVWLRVWCVVHIVADTPCPFQTVVPVGQGSQQ